MVEDTDEEIHWGGGLSGRVPSTGCPHGVGGHHPPGTQMCSPTQKLSRPHTIGIFMELPHVTSPSINSISSLSPLSGGWGGGLKILSF